MSGLNVPLSADPYLVELISALQVDYQRKEIDVLGAFHDGTNLHLRFKPPVTIQFVRVHVQSDGAGEGGGTYDPVNYVSSTEYDCWEERIQDVSLVDGSYWIWLIPVEKDALGAVVAYDGENGTPDRMSFVGMPSGGGVARFTEAASGYVVMGTRVTGDSFDRVQIRTNAIRLGDGTAEPQASLSYGSGAVQVNAPVAMTSTLGVTGVATLSGNVVASTIRQATADGADTGILVLGGGGAISTARGAWIGLAGNEHADAGRVEIRAGSMSSAYIGFITDNALRMVLNNAGNLGIGTTDIEAWHSNYRAIESGKSAVMMGDSANAMFLLQNTYLPSSGIFYKTTAAASYIVLLNGVISFHVAPPGTIDTAATFTTALTILNSAIVQLDRFDNGSSIGRRINILRNENASTPAAGHIVLEDKGGALFRIWPDDSGVLRIHTADPTNANDTSGTVVGTQTSDWRVKRSISPFTDHSTALDRVLSLDLYNYRMRDDSQRSSKQLNSLVIFPKDRRSWWTMNDHRPDNMAAIDQAALDGALIGSIKALHARIAVLEAAA